MKPQTYIKYFDTEEDAYFWMVMKNRASVSHDIYCLVPGPDDNYAVVDLMTAIELEICYFWAL